MTTTSIRGAAALPRISGVSLSPSIISGLVAVTDYLVVAGTGLVIYLLYVGHDKGSLYYPVVTIGALVICLSLYIGKMYDFRSLTKLRDQLRGIFIICSLGFLVLVTAAFALKMSVVFSRVWTFSWFFAALTSLCLARTIIFFTILRSAEIGFLTRNIAIVGAGKQAQKLLEHLSGLNEPWNLILGIFDDRKSRVHQIDLAYPKLGSVDSLLDFARSHRVDDVIITLPWHADERLAGIIGKLVELPVNVRLASDLVGFLYTDRAYSYIGGVPSIDVAYRPLAGWRVVFKTLEDKVLGLLMLLLSSPIWLIIAVAIRLDSKGPVFFEQRRYGFNNEIFSMLKFRTMQHNGPLDPEVTQASRDDSRVTRVGRFLRRTSLDELPQIFNVLKGTMSLIGPRPHAVEHNEKYAALIGGYYARHRVRPGITGWAQVNGLRGETSDPEKMKLRVQYDKFYIDNWSFLLDLQVLFLTVRALITNKEVY